MVSEIIDKLLLLLCSIALYILVYNETYAIIPLLMIVPLCCINIYFPKKQLHLILYLAFLIICNFYPSFLIFLPVMMYDLIMTEYKMIIPAFLFPLLNNTTYFPPVILISTGIICILAYYFKYKTQQLINIKTKYNKLHHTSTELSLLQEEKNRSLLENQDYEINLATLNERNRISKELHDHIGHLLSRSLLQIGALLTITKDTDTKESLSSLKSSLSEGMDSIRASIHNIHDESVDLYTSIDTLVKEFTFCPISLDYDMQTPPLLKIKYCFIAIIMESLSNIIKHSNATFVSIIIKEQPAIYQLIISDNGQINNLSKIIIKRQQSRNEYENGMGLQNIADRVKGFNGNFNISTNKGFEIFITLPKVKI
jgi:signal transduction histidine kinase